MNIIFLSEANLRDRLMIRDLVFKYKLPGKTLVFHDTFGGTLRDTRFVTKRLSVLFSEAMVYNNAFMADQRQLMKWEGNTWQVDQDRVEALIEHIQVLIIGPVFTQDGEAQLVADPLTMVEAARKLYPEGEIFLFPDNPLTPLAQKRPVIDNQESYQTLVSSYEEEKATLDRGLRLAPVRIVLPTNYSGEEE
ncbi:MAG: hypothetical protein AAFR59_05720 [Bacteroidota bacterium]